MPGLRRTVAPFGSGGSRSLMLPLLGFGSHASTLLHNKKPCEPNAHLRIALADFSLEPNAVTVKTAPFVSLEDSYRVRALGVVFRVRQGVSCLHDRSNSASEC